MQEVYENFNLMSDAEFKAWMLNTDLLKKEKEVIAKAYNCTNSMAMNGEQYYNETFNTKKK